RSAPGPLRGRGGRTASTAARWGDRRRRRSARRWASRASSGASAVVPLVVLHERVGGLAVPLALEGPGAARAPALRAVPALGVGHVAGRLAHRRVSSLRSSFAFGDGSQFGQ